MSVKRKLSRRSFLALGDSEVTMESTTAMRGEKEKECDSVLTMETREGGDGRGEIAGRRDGSAGLED
jgi:hypothetical protein